MNKNLTQRMIPAALTGLFTLGAVFFPAPDVAAQSNANQPYIAVINQDEVYIRSGNSDGHYPMGKVKRGEFVRVIGEKYEWAQVQTIGPVFKKYYGLIKYPERFADRLRIAPDKKSARTLSRIDVIAPNPDPKVKPGDSWKMIARLNPNETIQILRTSTTYRGETLHEIVLPETAKVWIKTKFLRRATAEETARWNRMLAGVEEPRTEAKETVASNPPQPIGATPGEQAQPERVLAKDTVPVNPVVTERKPPASSSPSTNPPAEVIMQPGPEAASPAPRSELPPRKKSKAEKRLEELEATYRLLQEEPIESAEIQPLRNLYLDLAAKHTDDVVVLRYAKARVEQLEIWSDLQVRRAELKRIKTRLRLTSNEAKAIHRAMEDGREYIGIGRLSASIIYDGKLLPRLLRLQDPDTGRTVAYLQPKDDEFKLGGMLGQLIGIVGESAYDGGLQLTLITPERIDLLAPQP